MKICSRSRRWKKGITMPKIRYGAAIPNTQAVVCSFVLRKFISFHFGFWLSSLLFLLRHHVPGSEHVPHIVCNWNECRVAIAGYIYWYCIRRRRRHRMFAGGFTTISPKTHTDYRTMPDEHGEDREKEERAGQEKQVEGSRRRGGKTRNRLTEHEMGILQNAVAQRKRN